MIKRKISLTLIIIVSAILLAIALSVILAVFDKERLTESVYAILLEIDKALIITIILGSVTKIVSSEIFSVKTNDRKMRRLGIYSIGEGRLDKKQANIMFGAVDIYIQGNWSFVLYPETHLWKPFGHKLWKPSRMDVI